MIELEHETLAAAIAGDTNAITKVLTTIRTPLLFYCRKHAVRPDDAEDVLQETLLKIAQHLPRRTTLDIRAFRSWIYTIAHNKLRDAARSAAYHNAIPVETLPETPTHLSTEHIVEVREAITELAAAMSRLTTKQRKVLRHRASGQDAATVARLLGLTEQAVRCQQHRAVTTLRERHAVHC